MCELLGHVHILLNQITMTMLRTSPSKEQVGWSRSSTVRMYSIMIWCANAGMLMQDPFSSQIEYLSSNINRLVFYWVSISDQREYWMTKDPHNSPPRAFALSCHLSEKWNRVWNCWNSPTSGGAWEQETNPRGKNASVLGTHLPNDAANFLRGKRKNAIINMEKASRSQL